ncbi:hydrogenase formation protein HypD [bacterium (Candidatus Blackallbacteria) CG17_big_fil_post_rev_8_21_14_2_50_48_46]|uniref:Hydrogenase formation protein HypD n=1 Tax=bacterium (Candidatus Blackallbacteria) CG17_big_fil_post_rev_8_21_14_2_50_48_46 TaxID=2014261 RepID=A0A2M7GBG6_9BACT|nr:MAG: hydrogenase formation protein HypD [bacterium (Candidatus Blackallbacteria) CG18_big_fil_WC_8_21_14_2_50_49_26]PIW19480.1 MAG: hydrogenase formation protein HypD [bacterium (Candidatus Blackallbacteria) CG17_big_fil_post_rev_8_21_14_2_50_48_46]PIW48916.1 MAG: hydrogenase formation protein HypD [bacterium (Candidatus Blackallbacteria) CG13_big_fil_rev_8_21_14_2_50_49_14]
MKYQTEYRQPEAIQALAEEIHKTVTRPWTLMEVCGGQTHAIVKYGLDQLLPSGVELLHGPGCPVCVTPLTILDQAQALARNPKVVLCSYGDMLRVPGSQTDLLSVRAQGGDVRNVYSPLEAVELAQAHPEREVVFLAVGFETTVPGHALALARAEQLGLKNFSLLVSHVCVPPALEAILSAEGNRVQGFLAAGHVCTIMGTAEYLPIVEKYKVPIVITGFEPVDILAGILACLQALESARPQLLNSYSRVVRAEGNPVAQKQVDQFFERVDRAWRGIGVLPASGLGLREIWQGFDARQRFGLGPDTAETPGECRSGEVLQGRLKPPECPAFGKACTPERPLGAPMVSSEGACAAWYRYRGT